MLVENTCCGVAEPHGFDKAPTPERKNDSDPAPAILSHGLYIKCNFFIKVFYAAPAPAAPVPEHCLLRRITFHLLFFVTQLGIIVYVIELSNIHCWNTCITGIKKDTFRLFSSQFMGIDCR
jgi:hypothetical protein